MDERLTFRKANIGDLDAICSIYEHTLDAEEAGLTTTGWKRGIYPVRATAESSIARDDMYVAELSGAVAGAPAEEGASGTGAVPRIVATGIINQIQVDVYAKCDWKYKAPDEDISVLHTLAVDPAARGMGIGPAFVRFWEKLAIEQGCSVLRIDTNARNKRARKMYASLGYSERDIIPTIFNGIKNIDLVLMEKFIGAPQP